MQTREFSVDTFVCIPALYVRRLNEAAVKYNGRKKLYHARIFYIRLVYFYIRLLYYDHITTAWCNMIIIQQPGVIVHQQEQAGVKSLNQKKRRFKLYRFFF